MTEIALAVITGGASFVGAWAAQRVHMHYLRRDVDWAHKRIDRLEEISVDFSSSLCYKGLLNELCSYRLDRIGSLFIWFGLLLENKEI